MHRDTVPSVPRASYLLGKRERGEVGQATHEQRVLTVLAVTVGTAVVPGQYGVSCHETGPRGMASWGSLRVTMIC